MELDVRPIPRARKHSTIFETFTGLEVGEHFVLINDHDPLPLRAQFDVNFARSFTWTYDQAGPEIWRVRITRTAATALPQVLVNTTELTTSEQAPDLTGAIWKIPVADRDLDANIIALDPGASISSHVGGDLDVMFVVLSGSGAILTEADRLELRIGDVVWLPKRSRRQIEAGPGGLQYLTTHTRKIGLQITSV